MPRVKGGFNIIVKDFDNVEEEMMVLQATKMREVEDKGKGNNSPSKDIYGPYYDEAEKLHETNPDEFTIINGKELKE
ncbi:hypothetical protein IHV10_09765 [Fictibacillus sp. 5RED26]|jgi:hypothetical protein|uniref:hypothetical protein n=1 Tax=Fictibacillus sp. 5RED26 TaxID=2745876 RepID=UPI0018CF051F|nr:hypothetical protein [Fictibacillus sp. 5RED26]MBH0156654.1 hypothetical protein [Fictibacillus sp. 5RED26]